MEKNFIRYIIIFFISVIFTLYLFEFYLLQKKKNFSSFIQERIKIKETEIKKFDRRSVLEVFNSLKDKENVTAKFLPTLFLNEKNNNLFPLSGVSSIKTIFCNENGYMSYYFSDRYGFNNPDNEWKQIEENKRDESGGDKCKPT